MERLLSRTFRSLKSPNPNPNLLKSSSSSSPSKPIISLPKLSSRSWCVYLILSTNVPIKTYVGVTTDFPRRLRQHNGELKGGAKASHAGRPWVCACIIRGFKDQSEDRSRVFGFTYYREEQRGFTSGGSRQVERGMVVGYRGGGVKGG
ncbi:hypothetical protein FH972_010832 [Carpinus fangiana]|uniref:GIY-YIG domain-containing protein n=1 Tax=Carpinus fangiana TaxID=176857 RepID=A0A660KPF9_9ROSI|nr:hypothetical protein FH972_010832 [Carpinus fangiana]